MTDLDSGVSFSPDGKQFVVYRNQPFTNQGTIFIADQDGSNVRPLYVRKFPDFIASAPAWSPDGKTVLAGAREGKSFVVLAISAADGNPRTVLTTDHTVGQMAWLGDGRGFLFVEYEPSVAGGQIYYASFPNGKTRRLTNDLTQYALQVLSITPDASAMAVVQIQHSFGIYLAGADHPDDAKQITPTGFVGEHLRWLPSGMLVYNRDRNKMMVSDLDGSQAQQIADTFLSVEPCGKYLVYPKGSYPRLFRADADGKNETAVGGDPPVGPPSCPSSAQNVYYTRPFKGFYRAPISGGGEQDLPGIFREGTLIAIVSPDERLVATVDIQYREGVAAQEPNQMRIMPVAGGAPLSQFDIPTGADPTGYNNQFVDRNWTRDSKAVAYLDTKNGVTNIWSQPVSGGPPMQLTHFTSERMMSFDFSADGKQIVYSRGHSSSDAVRITNLK
jgi:Tol biopolymer transport system component